MMKSKHNRQRTARLALAIVWSVVLISAFLAVARQATPSSNTPTAAPDAAKADSIQGATKGTDLQGSANLNQGTTSGSLLQGGGDLNGGSGSDLY